MRFSILNSQFSIYSGTWSTSRWSRLNRARRRRATGMLETIRQYALEKLAGSGEADALRRRHATYFRDTVQSYTSEREWLRGNALEIDNLRAALAWSQSAAGDPALALDLADTLGWFEFLRGDYQGARRLSGPSACVRRGANRYAEIC